MFSNYKHTQILDTVMKMLRSAVFFLFLIFTRQLVAQPTWIRDSLDIYVARSMKAEQLPGLALAVIQDGKVVLQRTYGVRENTRKERVDENTLFMIGSNTKAYTGTSLALLEQEGKLSLEDKATKWLPSFQLYDRCVTEMVTLRDLLCHRIGMRTFQGDFTFWGSGLSREEVIEKMAFLVPTYDFRTRFGYCNSAFLTAGQVIPAATGKTWEEFVQERIFKPLQMNRALALSAELPGATNYAYPHAYYDGKLQRLNVPTIDNLAPAGSISLSVSDMTHWLLMQMDTGRYAGKRIFPKDVILKTWEANTIVNPRSGDAYGLGWFISHPEGKKMIHHTGGVDGFLSASAFLPELRLGVIVLTNSDNNTLYASLRDQLLQAYTNESFVNIISESTAGWEQQEKDEAQRIGQMREAVTKNKVHNVPNPENYTGVYTNPLYGDIKVALDQGQLRIFLTHHIDGTATLESMGNHQFMCSFGTTTLGIQPMSFTMGSDGKATGLTLKVNDFVEYGAYTFTRK